MNLEEERARLAAFETRSKALLQASVASASPQLRARIARVRERALSESQRTSNGWARTLWIPATGLAALAVLAIVYGGRMGEPAQPVAAASVPAADVALLLNADNLDLLEQMEFYRWLESEPGALDAAPTLRTASRS